MTPPLLDVSRVDHHYGPVGRRTTVLHDVTLTLSAGEVLALAGRSGSGKSTLCHLIAGIERPGSGSVTVGGTPAHEVEDWTVVSFLPQRHGLAEEFTVAENAFLPCMLRGLEPLPGVLDVLGLSELSGRPARATSLGEQQRVGIARALAARPALAVLDEPTGHQDDENVTRVLDAIGLARRTGTAVVVATHDDRVLAVADRVVRMSGGRVTP